MGERDHQGACNAEGAYKNSGRLLLGKLHHVGSEAVQE